MKMINNTVKSAFLIMLVALLGLQLTGATTQALSMTKGQRDPAKQAVQTLLANNALGVQIRITDGTSNTIESGGTRRLHIASRITGNERFRAASITKMFTSIVILQLQAERKLDLDVSINTYLPGLLPSGDVITVRMLMQQTSGLYDYANEVQRTPEETVAQRYTNYTLAQLVSMTTAKPLAFTPGTKHQYSNTNYIVLGMLIEKLTNRPYADAVNSRIIRPYHLKDTTMPGKFPYIIGKHSHGYIMTAMGAVDITNYNMSVAGSAGEIISSTKDLDALLKALFQTRTLLPSAQLKEMQQVFPALDVPPFLYQAYGLGIYPITLSCGKTAWGHSGGGVGFSAFAFSSPDGKTRITASVTQGDKEIAFDKMYTTMNRLMSEVMCSQK